MNEAPKAKIGRRPKAFQEQVNRRLEKGEKGRPPIAGLNALPEVLAALAVEFVGEGEGSACAQRPSAHMRRGRS